MSPLKNAAANESGFHLKEILHTLPPNVSELRGGTFLFYAYGCALIERQTESGAYVYTAINIKTDKTVILSRRKQALQESDYVVMASKTRVSQ